MDENRRERQDGDRSVWSIEEASTQLAALIDQARRFGPQEIAQDGEVVVVVRAPARRKSATGHRKSSSGRSLLEIMRASPHKDVELDLSRMQDKPREIEW